MHNRQYYRLSGKLLNSMHLWKGGVKHLSFRCWQSSDGRHPDQFP